MSCIKMVVFIMAAMTALFAERLRPSDFEYRGAIRLPQPEQTTGSTWAFNYVEPAMAYYPGGDPGGSSDGYPGSLYLSGHPYDHYPITEVTIPAPVSSPAKNVDALPVAQALRPFTNIIPLGVEPGFDLGVGALTYVRQQGNFTSDKILVNWTPYWLTWSSPRLSMVDLNLTNVSAPWHCGPDSLNMRTVGYQCVIPQDWADQHVGGKNIAVGNPRWGQGSGTWGPNIVAYAPWTLNQPVTFNSHVADYKELLRYPDTTDRMWHNGFCTADEWWGLMWPKVGDKSALIISGRNSKGICLYDNGPYAPDGYNAHFLLYDPDDLAEVANGTKQMWEPLPETLDVTSNMYGWEQHGLLYTMLFGAAYDSVNQLIYVVEVGGEYPNPLIHVWHITATADAEGNEVAKRAGQLTVQPNPFNPQTKITVSMKQAKVNGTIEINIYDSHGKLVQKLTTDAGEATWDASGFPSGVYVVSARYGDMTLTKRAILLK